MAAGPIAAHPHRVRDLNDAFRRNLSGGRVVLSAEIAALPSVDRAALLAVVRGFDRFDADNDPHGEHDFGVVAVANLRCFFGRSTVTTSVCASPRPTRPTQRSRPAC